MSVTVSPSIFGSFNARNSSPENVARTFVPPYEHFRTLAHRSNTLVVGPRGSGKTTLLKMLHPAALESWTHKSAPEYRERIDYAAIFVWTDITWGEQLKAIGTGRLHSTCSSTIARAAVTTHILRAAIETLMYRCGRTARQQATVDHLRFQLSDSDERTLVAELAAAWHITRTLPTLAGLRNALTRRLSDLGALLASLSALSETRQLDAASAQYLHLKFLPALRVAQDACETITGQKETWALVFDELELAPAWLRRELFQYLRGPDPGFLVKISISPYAVDLAREMMSDHTPQATHDYHLVRLWYANKDDSYEFCAELFKQMLSERNLPQQEPEGVLGKSLFPTDREDIQKYGTAYHSRSPVIQRLRALAKIDETFRTYLNDANIDLRKPERHPGPKRAATLRKVVHTALLREFFLTGARSEGRVTGRSRKVPSIYGGAESVFAMVEGNPRWLKGILGPLLDDLRKSTISKSRQVRAVLDAGHVFRAMLRSIPCPPSSNAPRGLLSILDPVGHYFRRRTIQEDFNPQPPTTFICDGACGDDVLEALGKAMNAGAIILVSQKEDPGVLTNLVGRRFRLSYLLAPHYSTPLVLGREIHLSTILADVQDVLDPQPSLFDGASSS